MEGVAFHLARSAYHKSYFNSRPRVEGVFCVRRSSSDQNAYFNSRPRVEGVIARHPPSVPQSFQFSPSRGGRLPEIVKQCVGSPISILALAWRASGESIAVETNKNVFQFSPSRGGRLDEGITFHDSSGDFNSRPRVEGVIYQSKAEIIDILISILALAWRASRVCRSCHNTYQFQFSPSRGGRPVGLPQSGTPKKFQFSPSRGGRPLVC